MTAACRPQGFRAAKLRLGVLVVAAALAGCAAQGTWGPPAAQPTVYPPAAFRHRVSSSEVDVYWNCARTEPDVVRLDGVVQNSGGRDVEFVELDVDAVDARGRSVSGAKTSLPDLVLYTHQISPFVLTVRSPGAGGRLDLYYEYRLAPRAGFPGFARSPIRQMARDVCSDTQHLVPKPGP